MSTSFAYQVRKYPIRVFKTVLTGLVYIGIGMFISLPATSLYDLQILAATSIERIAMILPLRTLGFAVGSVIGAFASERIDHQILFIMVLAIAIFSSFCFPLFANVQIMYIFILIGGAANGCLEALTNIWLTHLWAKETGGFMQILHFTYGLGNFIGPFIVQQFLSNHKIIDIETVNKTNETIPFEGSADDLMIQWPFLINAFYYLLVLFGFILSYYWFPENPIHPSRTEEGDGNEESKKLDKFRLHAPLSKGLKIMVVVLSTIAMNGYIGASFGSLLAPFAVESNLKLSPSEASFLTSTYWANYTFLRIVSLLGMMYFSARSLLLFDYGMIISANVIMLFLSNDHEWALWLGSCLIGIGCSSLFATIFLFVEQLTPVSPRMAAGYMISVCFGELIIPLIISPYIRSIPRLFLWVISGYSFVSFLCIFLLMIVQYILLKKQRTSQEMLEMQRSMNYFK